MPVSKDVGLKYGFRSGLEEKIAAELKEKGVRYRYEDILDQIHYTIPARTARYKPDFVILHNGIIVETKGRFMADDRKKHLLIREQLPDLDIRFLFSNSRQKIGKKSATSYADWCNGKNPKKFTFKFADKTIPNEWIE